MKKRPATPKKITKRKPVKKLIQQAAKRLRKSNHDPRLHKSRLGSMKEPDAVCVTICTPAYEHLRKPAIAAFKKHLGLPVIVIDCADEDGFASKMQLDLLIGPRKIVFCDIDWRPLREFPKVWESGEWCAVRDYGASHPDTFASHDIKVHKLDHLSYWNSGFFTCDLSKPWHQAVFVTARAIWRDVQEKKRKRVGDFGDQFYLNAAMVELGMLASLLPAGYNWLHRYMSNGMRGFQPRVIHAVHAAGYGLGEKGTHLAAFESMFNYPVSPLCDGVAAEFNAMATEL